MFQDRIKWVLGAWSTETHWLLGGNGQYFCFPFDKRFPFDFVQA